MLFNITLKNVKRKKYVKNILNHISQPFLVETTISIVMGIENLIQIMVPDLIMIYFVNSVGNLLGVILLGVFIVRIVVEMMLG